MTLEELQAAWTRWMHRNDVEEDLETLKILCDERIKGRILRADVDLDAILSDYPGVYLHCGLMFLHQLAQDDEGLAREEMLFNSAIRDHAFHYSIANVTADPLYVEEEDE